MGETLNKGKAKRPTCTKGEKKNLHVLEEVLLKKEKNKKQARE